MFTGIIEEIGEVAGLEQRGDSALLTVDAGRIVDDLRHGASIAVNGCAVASRAFRDACAAASWLCAARKASVAASASRCSTSAY